MGMQLDEIRSRISRIDTEMAELFVKRMEAAKEVGEYKKARGLAVEDPKREAELIAEKSRLIADEEIRQLYVSFLQNTMDLSKRLQYSMMHEDHNDPCTTA